MPREFYSVYEQDYLTLTVVRANYESYDTAMHKAKAHTLETCKTTVVIKHCAVVKKIEIVVETLAPSFD